MIDLLLEVPSHVRERLARALETGLLPTKPSPVALRSVLGNAAQMEPIQRALMELDQLGITSQAAALWVRTIAAVEARAPRTDLVWSGPEVPGLHARDTRRVYEEVLGAAQRAVWLSTYVVFDGPRAFGTLAKRMDAVPGLRVTLLLNIQRRRGDTTAVDDVVRRFTERLWKTEWPGTSRPAVFYDPRSLDPESPGVLHAKVVVADEETVLVTSANLTEAAMERNIELGLLTRDRAPAASIAAHFRGLIDRGLLYPLPAE